MLCCKKSKQTLPRFFSLTSPKCDQLPQISAATEWKNKHMKKKIHYKNDPDIQKWYANKQTFRQKTHPHISRCHTCGGGRRYKHTHTDTHVFTLTAGSRSHFQRNAELIKIHKYRGLPTGTQRGALFQINFTQLSLCLLFLSEESTECNTSREFK